MATTFDNHTPINFANAEQIASTERDGGCYSGIGTNLYRVMKGKRIHLYHYYSSGCEYNNRVDSSRVHLGVWDTPQELITALLSDDLDVPRWARNELLDNLGHTGEDA